MAYDGYVRAMVGMHAPDVADPVSVNSMMPKELEVLKAAWQVAWNLMPEPAMLISPSCCGSHQYVFHIPSVMLAGREAGSVGFGAFVGLGR